MSLPNGFKIERYYVAVDMIGEAVRRLKEVYESDRVLIEDSSGYEFGDFGICILVETKFDVKESMARMDKFQEWWCNDVSRHMQGITIDHCYVTDESASDSRPSRGGARGSRAKSAAGRRSRGSRGSK